MVHGWEKSPSDVVKAAGLGAVTYSVSAFEEFQRHNQSFASVASYNPFFGNSEFTLTGNGEPQPVATVMISEKFFQTLGVPPEQGRLFLTSECQKGSPHAVILSNSFWRHQFNANLAIIGQSIALSKTPYTVVGVLPASFDFGSVLSPGLRMDVYVPAVMDNLRGWGNTLAVIGRLKPNVTVTEAQSEADRLFPQLKAANKDWEIDYSSRILTLKGFVSGKLRRSLIMLWWAVGLILLIVSVNLSNLLLARSVARSKEFALRTALGAERGRLFRQLLTEGLVLACSGSLLGLATAFAITTYLARQTSLGLPLLDNIKVDGDSVAWTLLLTTLTTLLFGGIPALKLAGGNVQAALKDSGIGISAGRKPETLRAAMVISEVALSCILLIGAGLLLRSFEAVLDVDLGFQPSRAFVMKIDYDDGNHRERRAGLLQEMLRNVRSIPGIQAAGIADMLPLGRNRSWAFGLKGKTYPPGIPGDIALVRIVTPGYLSAMRMHLRSGRDFTWHDLPSAPPVMIVNQSAASHFGPGKDPLTQTAYQDGDKRETRVVGMISNVRENSLETAPEPEVYLPIMQADPEGAELVMRTNLAVKSLAPSVMKVLRTLNPAQPASELRPLQEMVDRSISPRRFFAVLVSGFALLGLVLASLGIYGVISYTVSRQTQEIGIRMALGAGAREVQMSVVARALKLAVIGAIAGSFAAALMSQWISSLLFATNATDPITFGAIALLLVAVALIAGYLPARRASQVDPMLALRTP